jgi:hypothetical protein
MALVAELLMFGSLTVPKMVISGTVCEPTATIYLRYSATQAAGNPQPHALPCSAVLVG